MFNPDSVVPLWLDGQQKQSATTFTVISPNTKQPLWKASSVSIEDADAAVQSAQKAFETWRLTKPHERQRVFRRAYDLLKERREQSMKYSTTETCVPEIMFGFEYDGAMDICNQLASIAGTDKGFVVDPAASDTSAMVLREPYGVILAIAPWNAPHALAIRACLFPLAAGNTVVLKGPELAPATMWHLVDILHEAGLPAGCLNTIYHRPEDAAQITKHLIEHPAVRKVNFTGSTAVGATIASLCGKNIKPCVLELGGKAPAIVCEDADLGLAAEQCALAAFSHAGQVCMSTERIIVRREVIEPFKATLKEVVGKIFGGEAPLPILINEKSVDKNRSLLKDALEKGAKILYKSTEAGTNNNSIGSTVLENVDKSMRIFYEESFGPIVSIYAVDTDEEALALANDTEYGLTSAVFTNDLRRGMRLAKGIDAGAVHINNMTIHDESALPHGGSKASGFGRFNGADGLREWLKTKSITWRD
ncbi:Aldehyde/histidinol dehydrogenase [Plectosphaerella plurivora]|uniref:Aldehyde/histidinol dehydrogenase n=1 Tax=Plectosphaerella plurivora TaxID=936078 RepID=A0A9P9A5Q5_9PEZI|nr:Aldehyde/histidinol dehydrogenase [Plectosphaerella plurivora]